MLAVHQTRFFACDNFQGEEEDYEGDPMTGFCSECNQCEDCHSRASELEECEECRALACSVCMVDNLKRVCVGCYNGRRIDA